MNGHHRDIYIKVIGETPQGALGKDAHDIVETLRRAHRDAVICKVFPLAFCKLTAERLRCEVFASGSTTELASSYKKAPRSVSAPAPSAILTVPLYDIQPQQPSKIHAIPRGCEPMTLIMLKYLVLLNCIGRPPATNRHRSPHRRRCRREITAVPHCN